MDLPRCDFGSEAAGRASSTGQWRWPASLGCSSRPAAAPIRHAAGFASARAYMVEVQTGCPTSRDRQERLRSGRKVKLCDPPRELLGALDQHAREF
jgi:hypothetical protein